MRALIVGGAGAAPAAEVLARRRYDVVAAAGRDAAVEALARGPTPDLVVVFDPDPALAALTIRAIRGHVRGETSAVIALVSEAGVETALDAGANYAIVPSGSPHAQLAATIAAAEHAVPRIRARAAPAGPDHELYFTRNPHPMWFFDLDTLAFVAVNDAAVAKYGWSREEFLRMTLKDIRPPEEVDRLLRSTGRVADGLDHTKGWRHRARDGRIFHVEIVSYPVRYAGRACELVLALDVSERIEAERQLEELRAQVALTERLASVGTLAAGVAHEINNPLTFVLANLAFVQERLPGPPTGDAAPIAEAIADAADGARRVRAIVDDLKGFSRADGATLGPVEVIRSVQSAVALAGNELRHRARVAIDVAGAPPALASEARLAQVLLNLLVNAAQALPEGDPAGNVVRVSARGDGDRVAIEVSDTGPGVPEELRSRIFDPFFTTKRVGEGTGLGLWVCGRIVSELGGTIELLPAVGRGATFRIVLPAAPGAARPATAAEPPRPSAGAPPARRPRVLIVDDEPLVGRALERALNADAHVQVDASPRAALARLARGERFDLVLCDVMMPELPAADFHAALERLDPGLARRVVFMTGGAFSAREQEFLARIPNACLEKPLDLARVRALVRAAG